MISIKEVSKQYGKNLVFSNLSFEIKEGNFYTLLGKNGIGKSTIMKIISGFLKPNKGEIIIDDEKTYNNKAFLYKKKIGCLLEDPIYIEKFTINEYLELICKLNDIDSAKYREKIDYYLDYFECADHKNVFIENCSKGIKQKTSIISTLLHNPKYLILDEPFNGLDDKSKANLLSLLKNFCNNGSTVLLATHDHKYIVDSTDYFIVMSKQNKKESAEIEILKNSFDNTSKLLVDIERLMS
ncbi:MAG: ABC transporter ATP-binding protein [Bacteroidales bacterium]|nr:ABC transporter ATP-binding protein [Bacteroidales bacterium]